MLLLIDHEKLRPNPGSLRQLNGAILKDAQSDDWLRETVLALEYDDGFCFREVLPGRSENRP